MGGTPVENIKPNSHLMLIKDSEACLTHFFFLYILRFIIFDLNKNELESESHLQMSKSLSALLLMGRPLR